MKMSIFVATRCQGIYSQAFRIGGGPPLVFFSPPQAQYNPPGESQLEGARDQDSRKQASYLIYVLKVQ